MIQIYNTAGGKGGNAELLRNTWLLHDAPLPYPIESRGEREKTEYFRGGTSTGSQYAKVLELEAIIKTQTAERFKVSIFIKEESCSNSLRVNFTQSS